MQRHGVGWVGPLKLPYIVIRAGYQHSGEQHLHRYLAEYEFRYNNRIANGVDDRQRAVVGLQGIVGKRLTYAASGQFAD